PAKWYEPGRPSTRHVRPFEGEVGLAVRPDGRAAAALVFNPHGDLLVAVWDLATGQAKEAVGLPHAHTQSFFAGSAMWGGDRQLLLASGELVDLALHTWVCRYEFKGPFVWVGGSPDGRCWRVAEVPEAQVEAVVPKLGADPGEFRRHRLLLAAATLPHQEVQIPLAAARGGPLSHPGGPLPAGPPPPLPPP